MALQIHLGDRAVALDRDADALRLDDEPVAARFEPLDDAGTYLLVLDGRPLVVTLEPAPSSRPGTRPVRVTIQNHTVEATVKDETAQLLERFGFESGAGAAERAIRAPMPGLVLHVLVGPGDTVEAGQGLVVLEAMKMENELRAPAAGTVATVAVAPGTAVGKGDLLIELE